MHKKNQKAYKRLKTQLDRADQRALLQTQVSPPNAPSGTPMNPSVPPSQSRPQPLFGGLTGVPPARSGMAPTPSWLAGLGARGGGGDGARPRQPLQTQPAGGLGCIFAGAFDSSEVQRVRVRAGTGATASRRSSATLRRLGPRCETTEPPLAAVARECAPINRCGWSAVVLRLEDGAPAARSTGEVAAPASFAKARERSRRKAVQVRSPIPPEY